MIRRPPRSTLFPLHDALPISRENPLAIPLHPASVLVGLAIQWSVLLKLGRGRQAGWKGRLYPDRKSTRLNSSHANISYDVFCLEKQRDDVPHQAEEEPGRDHD